MTNTRSHSLSWCLSSGWQWADQHEFSASGVCCSHAAHMGSECWCAIDQSESVYSQGSANRTPATQHNARSYCTGAENMLELCWYLTVQIIHLICSWCWVVTDKLSNVNTQTEGAYAEFNGDTALSALCDALDTCYSYNVHSVFTLASFS